MQYEVPHFIDGEKCSGGDKRLPIYHPHTGEEKGYILCAEQDLIEKTVSSAKQALTEWSRTPPSTRAKILFDYLSILKRDIKVLAEFITLEHGKTLTESIGSLQRGIDVVEYSCSTPQVLQGNYSSQAARGVDCYSIHQPIGVCVGITPFNFPGMIPLWMFPLAIACGNTFILKPSEKDPSCPLHLVLLAQEAGVPKGVINLLQGDQSTVKSLIKHPEVHAISFVGSTQVARSVYEQASSHHKRVQAFGGAKNHCVVMPDADLTTTVDAIVTSAYGSAGERCMALSVALVVTDALTEQLIEHMHAKIQAIEIGSGLESKVTMGPLITRAHKEKVLDYITKGVEEGAELVIDGRNYKNQNYPQGFYLGPSLFDHVKPEMSIYRDEIFGPVFCIMRVSSLEQALAIINAHPYANGTAIFTRSGFYARQFADNVAVGMVGINVPVPVPIPMHSFGGWRHSMFADIGMYGTEAVRFYTKRKTVTSRWYP